MKLKKFLFSSVLFAPLVMGIAGVVAGSTATDNQLPGREVSSFEASTVKGSACGGFSNIDCETDICNGQYAGSSNSDQCSSTDNGCDHNCSKSAYSPTCSGA